MLLGKDLARQRFKADIIGWMKKKAKAFKDKLPLAFEGIKSVLVRPQYGAVALWLAFAFAILIYFFIQIGFYGPLYGSRLPVSDKLSVFVSMIGQMASGFFTSVDGFLLLVVSLLQGVAFALMIYTMRRNKKIDAGTVGGGGIAMFAAALGLGCVPCGTSLIMPIATLLFSSSAYAAANAASLVVLVIAFILSVYSVYRLGYIAYAHVMSEKVTSGGSRK